MRLAERPTPPTPPPVRRDRIYQYRQFQPTDTLWDEYKGPIWASIIGAILFGAVAAFLQSNDVCGCQIGDPAEEIHAAAV
jgi:hypothetical protein